ncbi:MAG: N-acetylmuramoyl-L-alanine amidase-like domain-containing protein, partial [Phycisphaerae bacterium]
EQARYADLDARPLQSFTNVDVADYLALRQRYLAARGETPNPADEVAFFAVKAVGQTFRLNALRFDYAESDCVVFVERCLAMGLSTEWASYRKLAERLRYKDGVVQYRNRNFSTLGDWLPNNAWLLEDITPSLPGAEKFTHTIRPKLFRDVPIPNSKYVRTVFLGHDWKSKDVQEREEAYIPRKALVDALPLLRSGDVMLVIYGVDRRPGCDHMGVVARDEEHGVTLVHAAPPHVRRQLLTQFVDAFPRIDGFKVLRLRGDAGASVSRAVAAMAAEVPDAVRQDEDVARTRANRAKSASPE